MDRRPAKRSRREERDGDDQTARAIRDPGDTSLIRQSSLGQETRSRSDREDPFHYAPKTTTSIDWRYEICKLLQLDWTQTSEEEAFHELQAASAKMKEAQRLEIMSVTPKAPLRYQIYYDVFCENSKEQLLYLEEPWTVRAGPRRSHLRGSKQVTNMELYVERHKEVSFLVRREYTCCQAESLIKDQHGHGGDADTSPMSMLMAEHVEIISHALRSGLASLSNIALQGIPHPKFGHDQDEEDAMVSDYDNDSMSSYGQYSGRKDLHVSYPYLWFYHRRQHILEATQNLEAVHQEHLNLFCGYIQEHMSKEWTHVDELVGKRQITADYVQYIYVPGEMVVSSPRGSPRTNMQASLVKDWLRLHSQNSDSFSASISTASWSFDGKFQRNESTLHIGDLPSLSHAFNISELEPYPLKFSDDPLGIAESLRERGKMFWRCRGRNYVCFKSSVDDGIKTPTDSRFMIDIKTLQQMHPKDHRATNRNDLGTKGLSNDDPPPQDEFIMCLPPTILGFNMQKKEWVSLDVDLIENVTWNTDAFNFLVIEDHMRELVQAVVTNQILAAESTDLIRGKGSGLIMLLHGGPGTGKTLTAESVAEVAKKPLYRVTCGDIGTKAEEVEKYLETVFLLGKAWDCVVLLDEADVFLEERSTVNLDRNALVSVFLRMLEYYDGILILTSNRVGTFDEAFKSRIQLTLHYQNLDRKQRLQIWRKFISRLECLACNVDGFEIDAENILSHIDKLATPQLNGREIRNSISTARQLARYRGQALSYKHLEVVIAELEKFGDYLNDLHEGFTADQRQNDKGAR